VPSSAQQSKSLDARVGLTSSWASALSRPHQLFREPIRGTALEPRWRHTLHPEGRGSLVRAKMHRRAGLEFCVLYVQAVGDVLILIDWVFLEMGIGTLAVRYGRLNAGSAGTRRMAHQEAVKKPKSVRWVVQ